MKIGDLVRYRTSTHHVDWGGWLGIIVREIPGTDEIKVIEWWHEKGRDHGSYRARDLELVNDDGLTWSYEEELTIVTKGN